MISPFLKESDAQTFCEWTGIYEIDINDRVEKTATRSFSATRIKKIGINYKACLVNSLSVDAGCKYTSGPIHAFVKNEYLSTRYAQLP